MKPVHLFIAALFIAFTACNKQAKRQAEAEKIVTEWLGKTIQFPDDMTLSVYGKDTLVPDLLNTPYRILLYVDSTGCTSCKLKIYEWQKLIAEADSTLKGKVSFIFFFQPKNRDDLFYSLKRDRFTYPVYIDDNNKTQGLNQFPADQAYQCFLLNNKNKVISIGNPVLNPGIWKLYKEIINGKITDTDPSTSVTIENPTIELKEITRGEKQKVIFKLKNSGDHPLVISDVKTSCGCTTAGRNKAPVVPGETAKITTEIEIKEKGYFSKTVSVYCNTADSPLILTIKGMTK